MMKKIAIRTAWVLLLLSLPVLLIYAMISKNEKLCADVLVEITDAHQEVFVNKEQLASIVRQQGGRVGAVIEHIDLKNIEHAILKDKWVATANAFVDSKNNLVLRLKQRHPIARVFNQDGSSFYLDTALNILPATSTTVARVPVFTSFSKKQKALTAKDTVTLQDVKTLALFLQKDSLWNAMIMQANITRNNTFELVPLLGNQIIEIGNVENLEDKFNRLYAFYNQVWKVKGIDKYKRIMVQYKGQVVATKRDTTAFSNELN